MLPKLILDDILPNNIINSVVFWDDTSPGITLRLISIMKTVARRNFGILDEVYSNHSNIKSLVDRVTNLSEHPAYPKNPEDFRLSVVWGIKIIETPPISFNKITLPPDRTSFIVGLVLMNGGENKFIIGAV